VLGEPRRFETVELKISSAKPAVAPEPTALAVAGPRDGVPPQLDSETIGLLMAEVVSSQVAGAGVTERARHPIEYGVAVAPKHERSSGGVGLRGICIVVPGILGKDSASHLVDAMCLDDWAVLVVWPPLVARARDSMDASRGEPLSERGAALGAAIDATINQSATVARFQLISLQTRFPDLRGKPILFVGESMGAIAGVGIAATGSVPYDAALFVAGGGGFLEVAAATPLRGLLFGGMPIDDAEFVSGFRGACTRDPLHAAAALRGGPVAVVTASADAIVPAETQQALWSALGEPPRFVWEGGHLELFGFGDRTIVPIVRRLAELVGGRSRAAEVLYRIDVEGRTGAAPAP
jgi:hypothetical protein